MPRRSSGPIAVVTQLAALARKTRGVQDALAVSGFSILTRANSSAAGLLFLRLRPFGQRAGKNDLTATAIADRLSQQFSRVEGGQPIVLLPPAVRGIGNNGGFTMEVEDRSGSRHAPAAPGGDSTIDRCRP